MTTPSASWCMLPRSKAVTQAIGAGHKLPGAGSEAARVPSGPVVDALDLLVLR